MGEEKAYIAVAACGCVTAAMVSGYESKRGETAELKRWMKSGRRVEITTPDDARERLTFNCEHDRAPTAQAEITAEAEGLVSEVRDAA